MFRNCFFALSVLVLLSGCGEKHPDGFPKLYPVSVLVTQDGKPLADAAVTLRYPDDTGIWAIGGSSDADGKAQLRTNGYPGAPLGKFKVVVMKENADGMKEWEQASANNDQNAAAKLKAKIHVYSLVKPEFNRPNTTPLEVEVQADTKTLTVDVSPAVKIEQQLAL
ncbi:MAG: DUF4198 domain-containing protein [Planctomycetaceae bacterium]|jgi:hypothetical protein|nr:DUF4198 domain-containing protein [Planctomycetaceae bacterium]